MSERKNEHVDTIALDVVHPDEGPLRVDEVAKPPAVRLFTKWSEGWTLIRH